MSNLKTKQLIFSSKNNVDIYEFQYLPGGNRRKPRSDRGRKRGRYQQAKDTAGNVAKYGAGLVVADQVFVKSPKLVKKAASKITPNAVKKRIGRINPNSIVGKAGKLGKYAVGLAIGDQAVKAVNRGFKRLRGKK